MPKEYIEKEALCTWCLETGPSYCDQCVMSRDGIPAADVRENVIRTQGDKLRAMSDKELAAEIGKFMPCSICPLDSCKARANNSMNNCVKHWRDWLKSPVEVEVQDG